MRKSLFILFVSIMVGLTAQAQLDTVGFWKVQYNDKEINPVTLNNDPIYLIPALTDSDKVNIFYYTESPCKKCLCRFQLRDDGGNIWKTIERKGYGDNTPFVLTGKELATQLAKGNLYMDLSQKYDGWSPWIYMGALKSK